MISDSQSNLINNAIIIKNISFTYPEKDFAIKLFVQLGIVPPYSFNYHRSDGIFRGIAFANFQTSHEAQTAVNMLNDYELEGRRLRVELKKKLSAEEEQRRKLEKQSKQPLIQQSSQSAAISPPSVTGGEIQLSISTVKPICMIDDILDARLRPCLVFLGTPNLASQIGIIAK